MNLRGFMVEARAKIMWGESPSSVREFLTSKGISAAEAEATIKELTLERNAEIRRLGSGRIVIGSVLIGVPGILLGLAGARALPRSEFSDRLSGEREVQFGFWGQHHGFGESDPCAIAGELHIRSDRLSR